MPVALSTPTTFEIRELTGEGRKIELRGRALPYRPFTLSGSQRAEFTWLPGSPEATVTVTGPTEDETTINGAWKKRFLGRDSSAGDDFPAKLNGDGVTDVVDLVEIIDNIRRQGQQIEVTWDRIVRRGILLKFIVRYENRNDAEWEMTFGWMSQGDPEISPSFIREVDFQDVESSWRDRVEALLEKFGMVTADAQTGIRTILREVRAPFNLAGAVATELNLLATRIQTTLGEIEDTIATVVDNTLAPMDAARRLISVTETMKNTGRNIADIMISLTNPFEMIYPPGSTVSGGTVTGVIEPSFDGPDLGDYIKASLWNFDVKSEAQKIQRLAALQQAEFAKRVSPDLVFVFVARDGQDLRDVSQYFYKTPDEWRRLLDFNKFTTSKLTAGQIVFVPQRRDKGDC